MIIHINQQKISFGDQYKIYFNKKLWYRASKSITSIKYNCGKTEEVV